ncbi:MAG TPA: sulfatase [Acidobacteriaceae bacterium]|jgi:arylsulfatase A-like enzyme
MNRREFLKASAAAASAAAALPVCSAAEMASAPRRPNVLYVFSDQHRAQSLPGEPLCEVIAPVLDRFRKENISMDRCISNYPLCVPHRAILMSGLYPFQSKVTQNEDSLEPHVTGLGEVFRSNGYNTGYVGKWHLYRGENFFVPPGQYRFGFDDWHAWANTNKHYDGITFDSQSGEPRTMPGYQPTRMTDQALDFIEKQRGADKPWFLTLSWNPPHPPYNPPPADRAPYDPNSLAMRPNVRLSIAADKITRPYPELQSMQTLHEAAQGYYGAITAIDAEFDRLLKALEKGGMSDNTIVIYTSDHGEMMGSHGHMAKQMPHEESCHVPFFVRLPGAQKRSAASDALFASIDIYPTLCGLAGIPAPAHCSGRDFSGIIRGKNSPHASEMVFLMNEQGPDTRQEVNVPSYRGVRTRTHTYAIQHDGRWCLYDNVKDPYQMHNLVSDPSQQSLIQELETALVAWSKSTGDPFPYAKAAGKYSSYPSA